jgi:hypothetical protein
MSVLLPVFLNSRVEYQLEGLSCQTAALGDWFLTPVRYLFDGSRVEFIPTSDGGERIIIETEYSDAAEESKLQKHFLKTVAYMILIAPAIILGTFFKALGYLSPLIRELHDRVALLHEAGQLKEEKIPDQGQPADHSLKPDSTALTLITRSPKKGGITLPEGKRQQLFLFAMMMMANPRLSPTIRIDLLQSYQFLLHGGKNSTAGTLPPQQKLLMPSQESLVNLVPVVGPEIESPPADDLLKPKPDLLTRLNPPVKRETDNRLTLVQKQRVQSHLQGIVLAHPELFSTITAAQMQFIQRCMMGFENPSVDRIFNRWIETSKKELAVLPPPLPSTEVAQLIQQGNALITAIFNGRYHKVDNEERSSLDLKAKALVWALMARAIEKGQEFDEGTFLILDPDMHLYNFMMTLGGYQRDSTHYKGRTQGPSQWGLDLQGLPKGKRTLLFDLVDANTSKQALFLKPENFGLFDPRDIAMHVYELFWARVNKFIAGADDLDNFRKERVPYVEMSQFREIIAKSEESNNRSKVDEKACLHGLSFMNQYLKSLKKVDDELHPLVDKLKQLLSKYDLLPYRTGREVIFIFPDEE